MSAPGATIGTAGHIDHGKTALVRALTGVDTDRLPEERERGISIALGYAPLDLPSGRRLSLVDVPGHERFVRTMVAGATGIDLFLMVVAADDGVMRQTREHARVLSALGLEGRGVVAVTKADVADPARAMAEAAELLPGVAAVAVSARTGEGIEALRGLLDEVAATAAGREGAGGPARLHADRVFSVHGAGTVVTGTLWSGSIGRGDELTILPRGRTARVRGVQVHDAAVDRAAAGRRVAVNLTGVGREDVARGDVLVCGEGAATPTFRLEARLDAEPPRGRITVHHGTREVPARAVALGEGLWQLRLDGQVVAAAGDRLVLRSIAPPDTIGGGIVVDPHPPRRSTLETHPDPVPAPAPPAPALPAARPAGLSPAALAAENLLRACGLEPPLDAELGLDPADLAALRADGRVVRLTASMHIHAAALAEAEDRLRELFATRETLDLAAFRDALGTSRKYAQALLEHFDAARVTLRVGDERRLRRRT